MTLIPFNPPPGLNSDDTTFAAEGRWADGNNVRFWNGKPQTIGGWTAAQTGLSNIMTLFAYRDGVIAASSSAVLKAIQFQSAASFSDITGTGWSHAGGYPRFDTFGDYLVGLNTEVFEAKTPLYIQSGSLFGDDMVEITQGPDKVGDFLVTDQRQIMAFACNEEVSGDLNYSCIRWCDIEDYTEWTTSATNNAGEHILDDSGGILTGRKIGPYIAIWTLDALWLAQFIGDPSQTFSFERVAVGCGALGRRAVAIIGQTAYWISGDDRFFRWTPGTLPEAITCPILREFQANIYQRDDPGGADAIRWTCIVSPVSKYNEVWFLYPDRRDGTGASYTGKMRYLALSLNDGSWTRGDHGGGVLRHFTDNPIAISVSADQPAYHFTDGSSILLGDTTNDANGSALNWSIRSADFYMDESQTRSMIRRVIPDIEDQVGDVSLTVYCRDWPQGAETTKGPFTLAEGADKKDFRASGKIFSLKFSGGSASGSYARIGKPLFDVVTLGKR